jgi:hypothetical protein
MTDDRDRHRSEQEEEESRGTWNNSRQSGNVKGCQVGQPH